MQHTGYTSFIIDHNLKASEFLKLCMRAFNIFIEYRDEPLSPNIPKELPKDDWHEKELVKAKEKLNRRLAMTDDEWLLDDDFVNSLRRDPFQGVEDCFLHSGRIIADKARELVTLQGNANLGG